MGNLAHQISYPLPSDDLLRLYSLGSIVTKVQRLDPYTGSKTKLRKSYRRFTQHLPGKDDVEITKTELEEYRRFAFESKGNEKMEGKDGSRGRLLYLSQYPEDDWRATNGSIEKAIPRTTTGDGGAGGRGWASLKEKLNKGMGGWTQGPLEGVSSLLLR